jgi:predicted RNA-binding Zn ribbon-like protein
MSTPTKPAPGDLVAVQELLNSLDIDEATDQLTEAEAATRWLREQALIGAVESIDARGLERLVAVRAGLRALTVANSGGDLDAAAVTGLERAASEVRLRPVVDAGGLRLAPAAGGVDGVIGRVLATVAAAGLDGTWARLKSCRDETCRWVFYDASKNVCGAWCAMGSCGNRAKARRYRTRHKLVAR